MTPIIGLSLLPSTPTLQSADGSSGGSGIRVATVAASFTLLATDAATQILTPTVNLTITLPSSTTCPGRNFIIRSAAATNVTMTLVQSAADGGATIGFIAPGEEIWVGSTGAVATGFVRVQRDPTSANANVDVSDAALLLGSSAALSRNYQRITFTASRIVTLPLSDTTPGGWFLVENFSAAGINITVRPNADDIGPAVDTFVRAGEWRLYVCVPTIGYVTASQGVGDNITSTADADLDLATLGANSASIQMMAPAAASRTVTTAALSTAVLAGRAIWIVHAGTNPLRTIDILNAAGNPTLGSLGMGDAALLCGRAAGSEAAIVTVIRSGAVNVETITAARTLVVGDLTNQVLTPSAAWVVTLPDPTVSRGKRFLVRNAGQDPASDILTLQTSAAAFLCAMGPGDVAEVAFNGANYVLLNLTRADNINIAALAADIILATEGVNGSPATGYLTQFLDPAGAGSRVDLPAMGGVNALRGWRIRNTSNAGGIAETLTIRQNAAAGNATVLVLFPSQEATFVPDAAVASDWRISQATLGGFQALGALAVGTVVLRLGSFSASRAAGAGNADIRLPDEARYAGQSIFATIVAGGAGEDIRLMDGATGLVVVLTIAGGAGDRAVILTDDGLAWNVVANLASP